MYLNTLFTLMNLSNIVYRSPNWTKYMDKGLENCFDSKELIINAHSSY